MSSSQDRRLYHEAGVSWVALVWAPAFAVVGTLAELVTGGPVHIIGWLVVASGLCLITLPWVYARRRFLSLEVTLKQLRQGRETVPAALITEVTDVGAPVGARVLGGGWSVPRKYDALPVKLANGTVVLAWARDVEALRDALDRMVQATPRES